MPEWLLQLLGYAGAAGAIYGGIRADIKGLHEQVKAAHETASEAHKRLDNLLLRG